jgi:RHS repeat-associated protein
MKPFTYLFIIIFGIILMEGCRSKKQVSTEPKKEVAVALPIPLDTAKPQVSKPNITYAEIKPKVLTEKDVYEQSFRELSDMLNGRVKPNFERAVFISENPYYNGKFTYSDFQYVISQQLKIVNKLIASNDRSNEINFDAKVNEYGRFDLKDLRYLPEAKKELYRKALSNWAIFKYLTDTTVLYGVDRIGLYSYKHLPNSYSSNDPFGMKDWTNSQVINLISSDGGKGNCFALTALYKILSDRLNADAKICTAPQHIYIQHQNAEGQYYNVELATAGHPADGIIQTLTHTPSEAIISGIALRDYSTKQSIGLCLVNLAKSYEHKFKTKDDNFLLRCAELALKHDSLNLNAILLKAQVLDNKVTNYAINNQLNNINDLKKDSAVVKNVMALEKHLTRLAKLGYRQMPVDMQEMILNPFHYDTKKWDHKTRNPRPFTTIKVQDPKDEEYWTLTKGMFQEVFEPRDKETFGHFTVNSRIGKLVDFDTSFLKGFIIDPVAFAYDFGARIYDARVGRFISMDPQDSKYPSMSPYSAFGNSPILMIDPDGETIKVSTDKPELLTKFQSAISTAFAGKVEAKINKDGLVTFHQLPETKLTQKEQAALDILNAAANNTKYEAQLNLVDRNTGGDKVELDNFATKQFDIDDMVAFGNDDNLLTSKSVLVHAVVEQLRADELRKHNVTDEYEIYEISHDAALAAENQTTNLIRGSSATQIRRDGQGGTTSENNSLLRGEDGKLTEVKYILKFQDGNVESQKTKPR